MNSFVNEIDKELIILERKHGIDALAKCKRYEYLCYQLTECEDKTEIDDYSTQEIMRCVNEVKKELGEK